jgi:DNA (cytosine-5)-methyltransferase 1
VKQSFATVTDLFCGAGGSSLGAVAGGAEVRMAVNHWQLAVDSHASNFPHTDHDCRDIQATDPRRYPRTDLLIASPECTNHSLAKGKRRPQYAADLFGNQLIDPSEERSRATMWDVPRFAERHGYELIIVENVVDARSWVLWDSWLHAMGALGYDFRCVYLNSMFCHPTPQSRDRMYVVFWRKGNTAPDLDIRPVAPCLACGRHVEAVQSWKRQDRRWGRYGARGQYTYACPDCRATVHPFYYPALTAIDWGLPIQRIGDRKKPLQEKTLARIRLGLERFKDRHLTLLVDRSYSGANGGYVWPLDDPAPTQTTRQSLGLVSPFLGMLRTNSTPRTLDEAMQTIVTDNQHFLVQLRNNQGVQGLDEALGTITAGGRHAALLQMPILTRHYTQRGDSAHLSRGADEPLGSVTAADHHSLTMPAPFLAVLKDHQTVHGLDEALTTQVAMGSQHALVAPPGFLTSYYGQDTGHPLDGPVPTVPTVDRHALVRMPFIASQYTRRSGGAVSPVDQGLPTIPGMSVHYLAQPGAPPAVEDCGFRMLEPHEVKAAMAFPSEYVVLGNKREQVRQCGNAVTPPAMSILIERCLATLR